MNVPSWFLWGFVATVVLTSLMSGSQGLKLTRMNITYLIGTMHTADRERSKLIGFGVHFVNGWLFSLVYVAAFHAWHHATWWLGMTIGFFHGAFVLLVAMPLFPAVHPRMASEQRGPTVVRQLEPPGFLALHYGAPTPAITLVAHLAFGAILGAFYTLPGTARCF